RATRAGVLPRLNGVTSVTPPIVLSSSATAPNQPPSIFAPPSLSVTEGVTLNTDFVASDPDVGQVIQVSVSGAPSAPFATMSPKSGNVYTLRLAPGASTAGNYTLTIKATDNATPSASTTQNVALTVFANRPPVLTVPGMQTVVASQNLSFTISSADPD